MDGIVKTDVEVTPHRFGLSALHVWITFFEYLFHISYRLEIKNWKLEGKKVNESYKINKKKKPIQDLLRNEMCHKVKPDGNTSRRFLF